MGAVAALLAVPPLALGGSPPTEIQVGDDFFNPDHPAARSLGSGTGFHWTKAGNGFHNVRQDDKLFRSGNPTTNPFDYGITASAGTYHYFCEIHGSASGGMDGVVKAEPDAFDFTPTQFTVKWAYAGTDTGNQFDVRFRVNDGQWRTWKEDTDKFQGDFGKNGKPVTLKPGKAYDFEARSEKAGTSKRSDWSPKLHVVP